MLLLTACDTESSKPIVRSVCPPLINYSPEFQAKVAEELSKLSDAELKTLVTDYGKMREACRALARRYS